MTPEIEAVDFSVRYGTAPALSGVNLAIPPREIFAIIGPASSGKTTFLRSLNRINDLVPTAVVSGKLFYSGIDVYDAALDVTELRRRIGMVFAVPVPLPGSIFDNVSLGPRLLGDRKRASLEERVEKSLREAYLWDEVKDRLTGSAMALSGGQQQRLCLARTLALRPAVLLLDEPCSGLDPLSTAKIEEALVRLKADYTIVLVTNNVMQASRVSDRTAFFLLGKVVEVGVTSELFTNPRNAKTDEYISGRFG
jgi:phosphate transport system ATP-binding protein